MNALQRPQMQARCVCGANLVMACHAHINVTNSLVDHVNVHSNSILNATLLALGPSRLV